MRLSSNIIKQRGLKEIVIDIDSTLIQSDVEIARKSYEGFYGFNPLMGIIKSGKSFSMAGFSIFRFGNAGPSANNLSLLKKMVRYLKENNPGLRLIVRIDSAGYNHRIMRFCDDEDMEFVIGGEKLDIVLQTILRIKEKSWEKLKQSNNSSNKKNIPEEVSQGVHFVGPEKSGAAYRFVVVGKKSDQPALFSQYKYSYRIYFTNKDRDKHELVHLYRERGDAENVIKEEKELLAYNLFQYFKYANLKNGWMEPENKANKIPINKYSRSRSKSFQKNFAKITKKLQVLSIIYKSI